MKLKFTLQDIRDCKTFDQLKPVIEFLCDNMEAMAEGNFTAYLRTIENQAIKVGSSIEELNNYATKHQEGS